MLKVAVVVIAAAFVAAASPVVFKDCGSESGTIKSVDVIPCDTEPCPFARGKFANVTIVYTANVDISKCHTKVTGYVMGAPVPFPVPDLQCQNLNRTIKKGETFTYTNAVMVKPEYPHVRVVVQWEVLDENDKKIVCFDVPVEITG
ncbi:NPC intracellular cholesterol transporter 2-like [Babylonia areolata]|uniref:NPC intracellular cholesterol transporter 2-like n=1 Tax=Babylonia areolata TaxID=304850 RepID=UPI003FD03E8E